MESIGIDFDEFADISSFIPRSVGRLFSARYIEIFLAQLVGAYVQHPPSSTFCILNHCRKPDHIDELLESLALNIGHQVNCIRNYYSLRAANLKSVSVNLKARSEAPSFVRVRVSCFRVARVALGRKGQLKAFSVRTPFVIHRCWYRIYSQYTRHHNLCINCKIIKLI